jgi:multidrug efflux pump subunit AcrA (membrane-fusion protein)
MQSLVSPALLLSVGVALIVTMGVAQRIGWISTGSGDPTTSGDSVARTYTCSMHPQIRQPAPGSCPICGMKLVAATAGEGMIADELAVTLTPAARRLAHIATAVVTRETMLTDIETIGAIAIDESRMVTIPSYIDGRIERLFADYTGVVVAEGDHLAVIYSPELYSAQVEYLESRKAVTGNNPSSIESVRKAQEKLAANSRQKLIELGMQERQITELEQSSEAQSRLTVYASAGGTVIEKSAMEGKYVKAGDPIYRIADLSTVWLMLELYPDDAARIRFGQRVKATMQSLPDETFEGRVAFIDPTVNKQLRTVGVRVEFLNDDARLRPGDYATAKIFLPIGQQGEVYDGDLAGRWISPMHPQIIRDTPGDCPVCGMALVPTSRYGYSDVPVKQPESLNVPRSAVLMAGTHSVVYVESEPGRFEIRPVKLGPILQERIIILDGLKAGDVVATSGNFLIDSQMQLAGKPSLIDPTRAIAAQKERKGPLNFETVQTTTVAGDADRQLDQLYTAYFEIQRSLAGDRKPSEKHAAALHQLAAALADNSDLPESARRLLVVVVDRSQHLHHMKIDAARLDAFRPISHAVVELAASIRSADPTRQFTHFFCPMVKGGGGDWLQNHADLRNPYYGAQMLKCGETVAEYPRDQGSKSANE